MKKSYALFIISLISFLVFYTNVKAQILLVPEIEQEKNQWCWTGVSKCVLDYYGFVDQQCDIAEYARSQNTIHFGNTNCCISPDSCNNWNWIFGAGIGGIDDILSNFGSITTTNVYTSLSETHWQTDISNGTPIIIRYGWTGGGGHFVVGYGVQGSDYYTMDPWFNEGYTISTYNWVLTAQGGSGNWTHTQRLSAPNNIVYGCSDSLACNYNLTVNIDDGSCNYNSVSYDTLISGISISWNGLNLLSSGDYSVTLINSVGCDSIVNLNLTVNTTGIVDIANNKSNLIKITDMLGQETPYRKDTPLFYIYDDGTVEKKIILE